MDQNDRESGSNPLECALAFGFVRVQASRQGMGRAQGAVL
jgi:hypothetical protein